MTTTPNREALIEKAAKALFEWDTEDHPEPKPEWAYHLTDDARAMWRSGAEVVLAVFEEQQKPGHHVDHHEYERQDMVAWLLREQTNDLSPLGRDYTDAEIAEALRRPLSPEPSAEDEFAPGECTGAGDCDAPIHVHGCYRPHPADQCDAPDEYGHIEPQAEPSEDEPTDAENVGEVSLAQERYFETLRKLDPSEKMARIIEQAKLDLAKRSDAERRASSAQGENRD